MPSDVRAFLIVNTDNRLMANSVRFCIDRLLVSPISGTQRGFLPGESLIQNVVETDGNMRTASFEHDDSAAVFFDFAAACPSMSHRFMADGLEHIDLPPRHFRNFMSALYFGSNCLNFNGGSGNARLRHQRGD